MRAKQCGYVSQNVFHSCIVDDVLLLSYLFISQSFWHNEDLLVAA